MPIPIPESREGHEDTHKNTEKWMLQKMNKYNKGFIDEVVSSRESDDYKYKMCMENRRAHQFFLTLSNWTKNTTNFHVEKNNGIFFARNHLCSGSQLYNMSHSTERESIKEWWEQNRYSLSQSMFQHTIIFLLFFV